MNGKELKDLVDSFVEVDIIYDKNFLKIKETLGRIGVASKVEKTLWQSCHILHKRNKYYIVHFKELFMLDEKPSDYSDIDKGRRNRIISLLAEWGLLRIINEDSVKYPLEPVNKIKIIGYKEKSEWELKSKYSIGTNR